MIVKGDGIQPGDLSEYRITITTIDKKEYDISTACLRVQLFQDIYAPFWTGSIFVGDTTNMITNIPIEQGIKITVTWGTSFEYPEKCKGDKSIDFILYGISNKQFIKGDLVTYELLIATKEFLASNTIRITGRNPIKETALTEQILKDVIKAKFPDDKFEIINETPTKTQVSFNANNWSWNYFLAFLLKLSQSSAPAKSEDGKANVDYLFFKSDNDKFIFESIDTLVTNKKYDTGLEFVRRPANTKDSDNEVMRSILNYSYSHFNSALNQNSGFEGNTIMSFDFTNKKINFTKSGTIDSTRKKADIISKGSQNSNIVFFPISEQPNNTGDISQDPVWVSKRKQHLLSLEQDVLKIQLQGSICSWTWLGKQCKVIMPPFQDTVDTETEDKTYSGKYLINAICHDIAPDAYRINLSLSKLSLGD